MGIRNVDVKPLKKTPPFRKIAMGTWAHPGDPQIYGTLDVDLTKAYAWRDKQPKDGPKVTVTHMIARAIGLAMKKYPDLNGFVRFRKVYLRKSVDMTFLVSFKHKSGREDLSSMRVKEVDQKSAAQIAEEMAAKVERIRDKADTEVQKSSKLLSIFPGFLVRWLLGLIAFITYTLNIRLPGVPKDPFAGCIITNVGMLGLDVAYAPLVPYSRVPVILLVGEAKKRPIVDADGKIVAREIVTINATIDHRFCDGVLLGKMVRVMREAFDDPDTYFAAPEPETTEEAA
jgi:pyruvate/2-oxoglutarate dehydrogenase complex dihydrolipoamide acyltransferase (E2) component